MKLAIVGLGRVGSWSANELSTMLGQQDELSLVDRDIIEESNLKGCAFYTKSYVGEFKVEVIKRKLAPQTSVVIRTFGEHLSKQNISEMLAGCKLVLDCTDNWQTRMLLNEYCWENNILWVYAGALGPHAMVSTIIPGETPCFACWANKPTVTLSCSEVGVELGAIRIAAEKQVKEAISIRTGATPALRGKIFYYNSLGGAKTIVEMIKNPECPFCVGEERMIEQELVIQVCGSGEWQFLNTVEQKNIEEIFSKLEGVKRKKMGGVVKAYLGEVRALVFASGRVVVKAKQKKDAIAANELILQKLG